MRTLRLSAGALLSAAVALAAATPARGQAADPALDVLKQAREASAKGDPKGAASKYQEFLQKFPTHAQASAAKLGLGLAQLQTPDRDLSKIAALLDGPADDAAFADRAGAQYWCGVAYREWARRAPPSAQAPPLLDRAAKRFAESAEGYAAASKGWADPGANNLPVAIEGLIRSRTDMVEALLAAGNLKGAEDAARVLTNERGLARSRGREAAWYVAGCAFYAADDAISAGRALVRLAPFEQTLFGTHARYLLARIHHLAGEATEAAEQYDAVANGYTLQVMAAKKAIQSNAPPVRDQPTERFRLEAVANSPAPEFVGDALFYSGTLQYEQRKFPEALERFAKFTQQYPKHSRIDEARLLVGLCQVQLGKPQEGAAALQPLAAHPKLGAKARAWLGRAIVRAADPSKPDAFKASLLQAAENFRQAAAELEKHPDEAAEVGDVTFDLGDALQRGGKAADAIAVFQKLTGGARGDEASVRLITCHQLAGQPKQAEEAFRQFEKAHPHSSFLAEATFHYAESAFAQAQAAPEAGRAPFYQEAARRYEQIIAKYPDLPQATMCRYRLAMSQHALGQFEKAADALTSIPEQERGGAMAPASYVLADALLRAGPPVAETRDAITASQRLEQLRLAIQALGLFISSQPQSAEAPEAMIKLGYCHQQVAALQADPQERVKAASSAREVYEALRAQFPNHPLRAVAEYERANAYALAGDPATALTKLPRFHTDPLAKAPIAPVALVREAQLLRSLGRAAEAVPVLALCRQQHEEELKKDPSRAAWVPMIRYQHGVALKEAKQNAEAIKVFQSVVQDFPASDSAKAAKEMLEETKP